jgi:hypothetical protein
MMSPDECDFLMLECWHPDYVGSYNDIITGGRLSRRIKPSPQFDPKHWETPAKEAHPLFGRKHSESAKQKMSAAQKGRVPWNKGKPANYSEEVKSKMREGARNAGKTSFLGRTHTAESRAKMSASLKGRVAPNKGKPMSEEQKAKLSIITQTRQRNAKGQSLP